MTIYRPKLTRSSRYRSWEPYIYLLPALIFLTLTFFYPIVQIIRLSLLKEISAA